MTAASLSHQLRHLSLDITLVESSDIGTVGVGEATVPAIRDYFRSIDLDIGEVLQEAKGTIKLGIEFTDWKAAGHSFFHPFGMYGVPAGDVGFHHIWHRLRQLGDKADLSEYNLCTQMALNRRFAKPPVQPRVAFEAYDWAIHFDAGLFAKLLRKKAEANGVSRLDALIETVSVGGNGHVDHLYLSDGRKLEGDLFIDCSGFRAIVIQKALGTGFEDWTHWLPCDRAVAIPCEASEDLVPYTRARAQSAGWTWRIPLQHRVGNGYVYSSEYLSAEAAEGALRAQLEGQALADANHIRFTTGHAKRIWNGNCIAIGLSAGFLEPLESTSLVLVQNGIEKLIRLFPETGFKPAVIDEYNRSSTLEYERIRDFIILHYWASQRPEAFWKKFKGMTLPDTLSHKIEVFRASGHLVRYEWESFQDPSWLSMYAGFDIAAYGRDPLADRYDEAQILSIGRQMRSDIAHRVCLAPPL
ncbi:tryptophan halogenase family protein [Asticcacaulis machinosus]